MFNDQAEEAMTFYTTVFKDGKIISTIHGSGGKVMGGTFELGGQRYMCYNAGPHPNFQFTQAVSLMVRADTQEEIDHFYETLSEGGKQEPCGWLEDKFGVSWQITPQMLLDNLTDPDREKADRVTQAMFEMTKINIADLEAATADPK